MSIETRNKKRKSGDDVNVTTKKVKIVKSAEQPAPIKSALKKSKPAEDSRKSSTGKETKKPKTHRKPAVINESAIVDEPAADDDDADPTADLNADQTAALLAGFSSSEDEDSDDEAPGDPGLDINTLPAAPTAKLSKKDAAALAKSKASSDPEGTPGVVHISRIPHGFYEQQMAAYFAQFGDILHIRLARNRKTGASKHFAFMEFASAAVAEIVAKTMDKYLLFGHILQVRTVPREQINEALWTGGPKRGKVRPGNKIEGSKLRHGLVREGWDKRVAREQKRRADKKEQLAEMGYEFDAPMIRTADSVPAQSRIAGDAPVESTLAITADADADADATDVVVEAAAVEPVVTAEVVEVKAKRKGKGSGKDVPKKKKAKVSA